MIELYEQFGLPVGPVRVTTSGWECDVAAAVLGAQVIEKHFTLDKSLPGPDQKASLDPTEFKAMVEAVRHVEAALGDGHKHLTESEAPRTRLLRARASWPHGRSKQARSLPRKTSPPSAPVTASPPCAGMRFWAKPQNAILRRMKK